MTLTAADATEIIQLWPDGPPAVIEGVPDEVEYPVKVGVAQGTTFIRNVSEPTLMVYAPSEASNGRGIIVVPGGGWTINAWSHEGFDVAEWLVGLGYTAFVLKYRVQASIADQAAFESQMANVDAGLAARISKAAKPRAIGDLISSEPYLQAREAASDDGRRAIEIVRQNADRFGINPKGVGLIGFSAGAFMAVDIALDPRAEQLAYIAPIYGGETRGASIPADAPPLFTAVAQDDVLVKIVEGLHAEWSGADRSSEIHVFSRGGHGFGMVKQGSPSDRWTDLFLAWIEDLPKL